MRMPHWPLPPWQNNIKYDLERISLLNKLCGEPTKKLPPVIHVAGTNGKGSTCAYLKSIFEESGYKVHMYTSPHLVEFNERIVISGEKIGDNYLHELSERVRVICENNDVGPTFFEGTTMIAMLAFAENDADVVILETGMGGRLDATNIVPRPVLTIITPISYDHMEYLGPTLEIIAGEKAGVIKPEVPCVVSLQTEEVCGVLAAKCNEMNSKLICFEYDFGIRKNQQGFSYLSSDLSIDLPLPSLLGDHQLINAGSVIAGIQQLKDVFKISEENISKGLVSARWPVRIEKYVVDGYNIWVDGAHNSAGAQALALWAEENLEGNTYLLLGMTKNRNVEEFCNYFKNIITKGFGLRVLSEPSSYSAEVLSERASKAGIDFIASESIEDALNAIKSISTPEKCNIIITGSLFLAADFMKLKLN